jgi:hypothetical protein
MTPPAKKAEHEFLAGANYKGGWGDYGVESCAWETMPPNE